jgi:hypothetical protein
MEKRRMVPVLKTADGNHTHAAEILGISREGLRTKMQRYGLSDTAAAPMLRGLPARFEILFSLAGSGKAPVEAFVGPQSMSARFFAIQELGAGHREMNVQASNSPPDTGGVAAPSRKRCEAPAAAQTGWSD